jgi:hypothetical protein
MTRGTMRTRGRRPRAAQRYVTTIVVVGASAFAILPLTFEPAPVRPAGDPRVPHVGVKVTLRSSVANGSTLGVMP